MTKNTPAAEAPTLEAQTGVSAGTKIQTFNELQTLHQSPAEFEEIDLGNGTVIRTYTGVQPDAVARLVPAGEASE